MGRSGIMRVRERSIKSVMGLMQMKKARLTSSQRIKL